jgi:wobble nucleotide-excising tRNase
MLKSISISKVATYGSEPAVLDNLSKLNFIFGSNGTGKTTISRVIAEPKKEQYYNCKITWDNDNELKALVYNRDFVDANFKSNEIKGIFTLGENNIAIESKISEARSESESIRNEISRLKKTLNGDNGNGGKNGELKSLEELIENKCWEQKTKHDAKLKGAFEGYRNDKKKFKRKVLEERENNKAELIAQTALEERAKTIFGETPTKEIPIEAINSINLIGYEANPVLSKRVLGKEDVDITGMIKKLGNSDWVRQGRSFYKKNDGFCPFCQQETSDNFAKSLAEYFDETFEADSKAIDDLKVNYESEAEKLNKEISDIILKPSRFLDLEEFKNEKQRLDSTISGNLQKLENKKKEPSQLVGLDSIANMINEIKTLINKANTKITQHNTTVDNITQERETLTAQVWKFVLEELNTDLSDYRNKKSDLDSAITSLNKQIGEKEQEINEKAQEISRLEKQTTSIQPTINDINKMLESFGFQGFSLAPVDNQHYKLIRSNGEDAKTTLSEGERTFVTFLYFYHLLKGSNTETDVTDARVVVFDDPVSSLDSDILFMVSTLIKDLFYDFKGENGYIKQIFVLTHNVYFHKEVSLNIRKDMKFWIIRKEEQLSKVISHASNPIKSSYELLWVEVKYKKQEGTLTIQNVLRRVLEYYFKILGGINLDDIYKELNYKNKLICKSLLSWVHDGSHSVLDDLYVSNGDATVETYLGIFKEIFEKSGHIAHYKMMMGEDSDEKNNCSEEKLKNIESKLPVLATT